MRKRIVLLAIAVICVLVLSGCQCKHKWESATCESPQTCSKCDETSGAALGHDWESATCVTAETCRTCGKIKGLALGHSWTEATCVQGETCSLCGKVQGEPVEHIWVDANYQQPKTCEVCGTTEGEPLTAVFAEYGLKAQPATTGAEYTMTVSDIPVTVTVEYCEPFEAEEPYTAQEGYEWKAVVVRVMADQKIFELGTGMPVFFTLADYYNVESLFESLEFYTEGEMNLTAFSVNYEGTDYPYCGVSMGEIGINYPEDGEAGTVSVVYPAYFHVPIGYDGIMLMYADNVRFTTEYEGDYQKLVQDENTLFLRIS